MLLYSPPAIYQNSSVPDMKSQVQTWADKIDELTQVPNQLPRNSLEPRLVSQRSRSPAIQLWTDYINTGFNNNEPILVVETNFPLDADRTLLVSTYGFACHYLTTPPKDQEFWTVSCPLRVAILKSESNLSRIADIPEVCLTIATDYGSTQRTMSWRPNIHNSASFDPISKTLKISAYNYGELVCQERVNAPILLQF